MAEYEPNSGIEFWFDFDGLLETVLGPKAELRNYSAYMCEGNVSQFRELHTNYYFQMRNGVAAFPVEGREIDPLLLEERLSSVHRNILAQAGALAAREIETGRPIQPSWLDIFKENYHAYALEDLQPLLERVTFRVVHDGFLKAQADRAGNIYVSSKLKTFLHCFNLAITTGELFGEHPEWLNGLGIGDWYFDHMFPYFIQPEIGFDLMRLPVINAPDRKRVWFSQRLAEMEIAFLLLHEMGHVYLQHFDREGEPRLAIDELLQRFDTMEPRLYQECEADAFALLVLADWPRETYHDVGCTGIEFLFSALKCMQETESVVRGLLRPGCAAKVNTYSDRLSIMRSLPVGEGWVDNEMRGWGVLCHMFETLYLEKLKALTIQELEVIIQHRKGHYAS